MPPISHRFSGARHAGLIHAMLSGILLARGKESKTETMPETVTANRDLKIIEARSSGNISRKEMFISLQDIERVHEDSGLQHVLLDACEQTSLPGPLDLTKFATELPSYMKLAILMDPMSRINKGWIFLERAAQGTGKTVKTFECKQQAIEWLAK